MSAPDEGSPFSGEATSRWLRATGAFLLGGVLFGTYLWLVGPGPVHRALVQVSPRRLFSLLLVGVLPVVVWGTSLHLVLARFGIARRLLTSVFLFTAASFLNSVTPFGQVGGDPLSAVLFKRSLRTDFETGLAAIGSVNALNRVGSLFLGLVGIGFLGTQVRFGETLEIAATVTVAVSVLVLVGGAIAWYHRQPLVHLGAMVLAAVLGPIDRLPGLTSPTRDSLVRRGHRFIEAIGRLVDAPWTLGFVLIAGIAGQLVVGSTLWVALAALGTEAPFALVLLFIPVAKLSGAAPTPGGFGSAEAVLTALLMATIGIDVSLAGAAALLYRASAFWLPALVGGIATAWYVLNTPDPAGQEPDPSLISAASPAEVATESGTDTDMLVTIVLLAVSVALVVLLVAVVHSQELLIEPDSLLVHTTRDSALVVLSFGITWLTLRRVAASWFD